MNKYKMIVLSGTQNIPNMQIKSTAMTCNDSNSCSSPSGAALVVGAAVAWGAVLVVVGAFGHQGLGAPVLTLGNVTAKHLVLPAPVGPPSLYELKTW